MDHILTIVLTAVITCIVGRGINSLFDSLRSKDEPSGKRGKRK